MYNPVKYRNRVTPAQLKAHRELRARWEYVAPISAPYIITPPAAMPRGSYLGVWCGRCQGDRPGSIYIGIELDGYCHS